MTTVDASATGELPPSPSDEGEENLPGWKRRVALFLGAQAVSLFGSQIVQFAIMWHLTLTLKAGWVVMVYAVAAFVPQAVLSLFGGTLADRINRKVVIIVADTVIALVTLGLAVAMTMGEVSLWIIFLAVTVRSIGAGFQQPAVGALLPQLTPPSQLMQVNGINQSIIGIMALAAPAVGGAVYAAGGLIPTFWIDVVTALLGVGIVSLIPVTAVSRDEKKKDMSFFADLVDGVIYVLGHRAVAWLLVLYSVIFLLVVSPNFLAPLMLARSFSDNVWLLAGNEIVFSAGMALGGVIAGTVASRWHQGRMLFVSSLLFGVCGALLGLSPLLGFTAGLVTFYMLALIVAVAIPFFTVPAMTIVQTRVEAEYMGRVMALSQIVMSLAMPLGMVGLGPLADRVSVESILFVTGILAVIFVLVSFAAAPGREVLASSGRQECEEDGAEAVLPACE